MIDSIGEELGGSGDGEVTGYFSPDVVELIGLAPDVGAGAGDFVLSASGVELRGTSDGRCADVIELVKSPRFPLWANTESRRRPMSNGSRM